MEKLRDHHRINSTHFKERYETMSFDKRKSDLLEKAKIGLLQINTVENTPSRIIIGYCVSSIKTECLEKVGEIHSIYVDANFRKLGIGSELIKLSLDWFKIEKVSTKRIIVAEGNEEVFHFYQKYGFYHFSNVLQQKDVT